MNKKLIGTILLGALAGCAKDASLLMDVNEIRRLCDKVSYAAFVKRANEETLLPYAIQRGAEAQCELEYRIKQQEVGKNF